MNQFNFTNLSLCDCDTCDFCDSSGQVSQLSQLSLSQTPRNPKIGVDMKLLKKGTGIGERNGARRHEVALMRDRALDDGLL